VASWLQEGSCDAYGIGFLDDIKRAAELANAVRQDAPLAACRRR